MDSRAWNEKYRVSDRLWSAEPNQFVAAELAELRPAGRALDLAAGEGRNALWLAERGWRVTAVDFSDVAIERGRARDPDGAVEWQVADVLEVPIESGGFDLVLLAYLQLPWPQMKQVLARAQDALAPGGVLLIVGHDTDNLARGYGGPKSAEVLYSPGDIRETLARLTIDRAVTVKRHVATDSGVATALDCLVRAHRSL